MYSLVLEYVEVFAALQLAIIGVVYDLLLINEGMILSKYYVWTETVYAKRPKLGNMLGKCVYCFFGQLSLWGYLAVNFDNYHFIKHVSFISLTIFFIYLIKELCLKIERL